MPAPSSLDRHSATPLYLQLKRLLEREIAAGALPPHSRVPSERELSEQFAISRMTVRQALTELIQEGRLYTSAGKGTFVAEPKIRQNLQSLTGFTEDMRQRGLTPRTRVLARQIVAATPSIAQSLRLAEGAPRKRFRSLRRRCQDRTSARCCIYMITRLSSRYSAPPLTLTDGRLNTLSQSIAAIAIASSRALSARQPHEHAR